VKEISGELKDKLAVSADLENEFQDLLKSPFEALRDRFYRHAYDRDQAVLLQKSLEETLGMQDPEGDLPDEGWRRSDWCGDYSEGWSKSDWCG